MDAAMAEATAFRSLYRVSQDSPPQPKTELSTLKQADGEVKAKAAAAADKAALDAALDEAKAEAMADAKVLLLSWSGILVVQPPTGHLWRDKWTILSGPFNYFTRERAMEATMEEAKAEAMADA